MSNNNLQIKEFFDKLAPSWDNGKRNYDIIEEILFASPLKEGMSVLDIACGTGVIDNYLYSISKREIDAIDLSDEMIKIAKEKHIGSPVNYQTMDYYEYHHEPYDFLVVFDSFPHFLDVDRFVTKAYELLKDDGYLLIFHDIGRMSLKHTHRHVMNISRGLLPVSEEVKPFLTRFKVVEAYEKDDRYVILLKK